MLTLSNVTKRYGQFTALENINLTFSNGVYGLLSPNGAGKTTLIKMLTTLIFPTKGEILWDGNEITKLGESYRDIIGYLPQDFGYYKNYSPQEFLVYIATLKGIKRNVAKRKTDELLEIVGLSEVCNKKMRKFSGGMIQRVGIAQAMLNNPKILILDEPTAGLDPKERVRLRNYISSLSKDRIVILSTHIVSDVETIANFIVMFKGRKLHINASPQAIRNRFVGRIYETDNIAFIAQSHLVLTERQDGGATLTRFASNTDCSNLAKLVTPNLEDVFLYVYHDEAVS